MQDPVDLDAGARKAYSLAITDLLESQTLVVGDVIHVHQISATIIEGGKLEQVVPAGELAGKIFNTLSKFAAYAFAEQQIPFLGPAYKHATCRGVNIMEWDRESRLKSQCIGCRGKTNLVHPTFPQLRYCEVCASQNVASVQTCYLCYSNQEAQDHLRCDTCLNQICPSCYIWIQSADLSKCHRRSMLGKRGRQSWSCVYCDPTSCPLLVLSSSATSNTTLIVKPIPSKYHKVPFATELVSSGSDTVVDEKAAWTIGVPTTPVQWTEQDDAMMTILSTCDVSVPRPHAPLNLLAACETLCTQCQQFFLRYQGTMDGYMNRDGMGQAWYDAGRTYQGMWSRDQRHGQGMLVDADGRLLLDGLWNHDHFVSGTMYFHPLRYFRGAVDEQLRPHGAGTLFLLDYPMITVGQWVHGQLQDPAVRNYRLDRFSIGIFDQGQPTQVHLYPCHKVHLH